MSGLEIAASVGGLLSLGIRLCSSLFDYCQAFSSRDKDVNETAERLKRLESVFSALQDATQSLEDRRVAGASQALYLLGHVTKGCERLDSILQKFETNRGAIKSVVKQAIYPFKRAEILELKQLVGDLLQDLNTGMEALHLNLEVMQHDSLHNLDTKVSNFDASLNSMVSSLMDIKSKNMDTQSRLQDLMGRTSGQHNQVKQDFVIVQTGLQRSETALQALMERNAAQATQMEQKFAEAHRQSYENHTTMMLILRRLIDAQDLSRPPSVVAQSIASQLCDAPSALKALCDVTADDGPLKSEELRITNGQTSQKVLCACRPYSQKTRTCIWDALIELERVDELSSFHHRNCPLYLHTRRGSYYSIKSALIPFLNTIRIYTYTSSHGAGGHSMGFSMRPRRLTCVSSPAFRVLEEWKMSADPTYLPPSDDPISYGLDHDDSRSLFGNLRMESRTSRKENYLVEHVIKDLRELFIHREASPYDVDLDDQNLLHSLRGALHLPGALVLWQSLVDARVPLDECDASDEYPIDSVCYAATRGYGSDTLALLIEDSIHRGAICGLKFQSREITWDVILRPSYGYSGVLNFLRNAGDCSLDEYQVGNLSRVVLQRSTDKVRGFLSRAMKLGANHLKNVLGEKTAWGQNVLHLAYDWPDGLNILLESGAATQLWQYDDLMPSSLPAMYAATCKHSRSLEIMLRYHLPHGMSTRHSHGHVGMCPPFHDMLLGVSKELGGLEAFTFLANLVASDRVRLLLHAQKVLPRTFWDRFDREFNVKTDEVLDGRVLQAVLRALEEAGDPAFRSCTTSKLRYGSRGTYVWHYAEPPFLLAKANVLWERGFRDVTFHNENWPMWSPLYSTANSGKFELMLWLLDKGAVFDNGAASVSPLVSGTTVWHCAAASLSLSRRTDPFESIETDPRMRGKIGNATDSHSCRCHCLNDLESCTPFTILFRSLVHRWRYLDTRRAGLASKADHLLSDSTPAAYQILTSQLVRLATFEILGISHTCCRNNRSRYGCDGQEIEQINRDQQDLIHELNLLLKDVTAMLEKFLEFDTRLTLFLEEIWAPRMIKWWTSRQIAQSDDLDIIQRIGVKLDESGSLPTLSVEDEEFYGRLFQWVDLPEQIMGKLIHAGNI